MCHQRLNATFESNAWQVHFYDIPHVKAGRGTTRRRAIVADFVQVSIDSLIFSCVTTRSMGSYGTGAGVCRLTVFFRDVSEKRLAWEKRTPALCWVGREEREGWLAVYI